jgi:hypothetical protein
MASAPASIAVRASSTLLMQQILTRTRITYAYGARFRNTARAGAPSCPPTFIGSTIKS